VNTNINKIYIAIDADSLVYKSCYRHQTIDSVDLELAYLEFGYEIGKIKSAVFRLLQYQKGDQVIPKIILSPKKSFRNEISDEYKTNRKSTPAIHGIKALKIMIMERLSIAEVHKNIEADDVCIYYSNKENMLISAIDKDVINASMTNCYDYNKRRWINPHSKYKIEKWYAKQALLGDSTDNIKGAPNIGEERSEEWTNKYLGELYPWQEYCEMFGGEELALMSMNLVRMDGLKKVGDKLIWSPWTMENSNYWEY